MCRVWVPLFFVCVYELLTKKSASPNSSLRFAFRQAMASSYWSILKYFSYLMLSFTMVTLMDLFLIWRFVSPVMLSIRSPLFCIF